VKSIEWLDVPSVCRRIAALLAVACLGACAPVTSALAQGAGDQQYQDPFGSSGSSGSSKPKTSKPKTQTTPSGSLAPLSPSPQTSGASGSGSGGGSASGSAGTSSGTGTAAAPAVPAAGTASSLPNTGLDTRVLLLGGAALLLVGLGLRLRSAPERF
jgi:LPXTG-motif cell wall-anchored protein